MVSARALAAMALAALALTSQPRCARAFDPDQGTWAEIGPPTTLYGSGAVYDPLRDRLLLFATTTSGRCPCPTPRPHGRTSRPRADRRPLGSTPARSTMPPTTAWSCTRSE